MGWYERDRSCLAQGLRLGKGVIGLSIHQVRDFNWKYIVGPDFACHESFQLGSP